MLAFIRSNYRAGDTIEISTSEGDFSGQIEYVTEKYIILRQPNGRICGIAGADVRTFHAEIPGVVVPQTVPATRPAETPTAEPEAPIAAAEPAAEAAEPVVTEQAEAEVEAQTDNSEEQPVRTVIEPKVVGHIDLEKLQQIDPKYARRRYFKSEESNDAGEADGENEAQSNYGDDSRRSNYVPAKGRITYYNTERRYGFIYDYATENKFYFHVQQIADPALYDELHLGTKVVYTSGRNTQGFAAYGLHLPNTFDELLDLAENQISRRHVQAARNLVEHILEVDPNYEDAKDLLDEINEMTPAPRFARTEGEGNVSNAGFNMNMLYSQAKKAYLSKDYAEAEACYLKAIEAGEKTESCVKDLVMLYVSRYKQQEDPEAKVAARQKAIDFLESHRHLLPDNLTNKQFLALNYYLPISDFENFIRVVDDILTSPMVSGVLSRHVFYLWQKSIALNKMGRIEEALQLIDRGLELAPRNRQLFNLKNAILYPEFSQRDVAFATQAAQNGQSVSVEELAEAEDTANLEAPATAAAAIDATEGQDPAAEAETAEPATEEAEPATEEPEGGDDEAPKSASWWSGL